MVQEWRKAMLRQKGRKDLNENVNDQSLFNHVVRGVEMSSTEHGRWWLTLNASGVPVPANGFDAHAAAGTIVRRVHRSHGSYRPCLPDATGPRCEPVHFTFGTLPMRPFTGGHTWFNQNVQSMPGHEEPRNEPITVRLALCRTVALDFALAHILSVLSEDARRGRMRRSQSPSPSSLTT